MFYSFDGKNSESSPIIDFETVIKKNIKLTFINEKQKECFVTLTSREISHIMRIGFHLAIIEDPT